MNKAFECYTLLLIGILALFGVSVQFIISINRAIVEDNSVGEVVINMLGYFTILTNTFAAIVLTTLSLLPNSRIGKVFATPKVFGCVVTSMLWVGIGFHVLLSDYWSPDGMEAVTNYLNHYIVPSALFLIWLVFPPKTQIPKWTPLIWEIYPVIYGIYIILLGELVDKYPYPFFDVNVIGYSKALLNGLVILLVILGIGYFVRSTVNLSSRLRSNQSR
jgi:hypothetical protein